MPVPEFCAKKDKTVSIKSKYWIGVVRREGETFLILVEENYIVTGSASCIGNVNEIFSNEVSKSPTSLNCRMALKIEIFIRWVRNLIAVDDASRDTIASSICRSNDVGQKFIGCMILIANNFFMREISLPFSVPREENSVVPTDRGNW